MNKPSLSRALPMSKPTGPVIDDISKGAGFGLQLRHVPRSDREDIEMVLRRRGRSPDEFYVSDTPSQLDPPRFERDGVIWRYLRRLASLLALAWKNVRYPFSAAAARARLDRAYFGPIATDVIVRSRKTGTARAYIAQPGRHNGPFAEWVNQFAEDLDNGLFE